MITLRKENDGTWTIQGIVDEERAEPIARHIAKFEETVFSIEKEDGSVSRYEYRKYDTGVKANE